MASTAAGTIEPSRLQASDPVKRLRHLRKTLKLRIAVVAGLIVLVAVWASTAVTLAIVSADTDAHLLQQQQDAAERTAAHVAGRVRERWGTLAAFARLVPSGAENDPHAAAAFLDKDPLPPSEFQSTLLAAPDGTVLAARREGSTSVRPFSIADRPFYAELLGTGRQVMSTPIVGRALARPTVAMLAPVFGPAGDVKLLVGASLPLDGDTGLIQEALRVNPTTHTVLVDRRDRSVVGHRDPKHLLARVDDLPELADVTRKLGGALRGDDLRGAGRFGASTIGWAAISDTDWIVFEISATEALTESLATTRRTAILANGVLSLLGTAAMFTCLVLLFRPMERLHQRAVRVLTEPTDIDEGWPQGRDEVGELSRVLRHVLRERAAAEQGSLRLLGQLQAIMDNASVGILFTRDDRFELVSPALLKLTGYSQGELFGKPLRLLAVSDEGMQALKEHIAATRGRFDLEFPVRRKDGAQTWVRTVGSAVTQDDPDAGTVWIVEDVTEARRLRQQLSWSATRDPLTELLNRREFERRLRSLIESPNRPEAAVLFLDLDRFKSVNDTGGHAAGDRLLCDIARQIESQVRKADIVARLGGDEFAVMLVGCPTGQAVEIGERIRGAVRAYRLEWQGRSHSVGASIGVVAVDTRFEALAPLMRAADAACYEAKHAGRDTVHLWRDATATEAHSVTAGAPVEK